MAMETASRDDILKLIGKCAASVSIARTVRLKGDLSCIDLREGVRLNEYVVISATKPGILIFDRADLLSHVVVHGGGRVEIGSGTRIGSNVTIGDQRRAEKNFVLELDKIVIGHSCIIGAGTVVMPGARIPDGTHVPPNSVIPAFNKSDEDIRQRAVC